MTNAPSRPRKKDKWHCALIRFATSAQERHSCSRAMSGSRRTSRSNAFFSRASASREPQKVAKGQRKYVITTVTSSDSYSGTKADVFIKIKGPKGEFTHTLEDKTMFGARFEQGKEDAFTFDAADVADVNPKDKSWPIEEVTLGVSGGGMMASMMGSDWKLYTVTIQDVATGARLTLVCDDWVKDDAPQVWRRADGDKKTGLRVAPASGSEGKFKYRVEIVTGSSATPEPTAGSASR